jgi:hypothetical protein
MAIAWTLARANGDTRSFEEWGIKSALDRRVSLARGTVELGFGRSDLLGSLPFDPDETLLIAADGDPYFRGRVIGEKRGALGSSEQATVTLADPWWYLEKIIFCRSIKVVADGTSNPVAADPSGLQISDFVTVSKIASDIVLSETETGSLTDSRAMIIDAVNYAIAKGAPIALGTVDDGLQIPREELHDVTCAELILKALRWLPDQTGWWDYSVDPPELNIRTRAHRDLLSLDVSDEALQRVEINPRHDLVLTGVTINYLRRHERTNFEFLTLDADTAGPNPLGIGALVATVELYGSYIYQAPASGGSTPPANLIPQEAAPAGLALSLYNAYKDLSFEGSVNLLASGIDVLYLSQTLNVLNGAPAWAAATMDIQEATRDLFAMNDVDGEYYLVELTVGPPRQLGPTDLVGLVRKGRTNPPPLIGGPNNSPTGGGAPKVPQFNYGNPNIPEAGAHPDIVLQFWHGKDVGFPNSWGGFDGERARIHQTFITDTVLEEIYSGDLTPGQIFVSHGIRFFRKEVYGGIPSTFPIYKDVFVDDYFDVSGHHK